MIFIDFLKYDLVICLFNKTQKLKKVKLVLVPPSALKGQIKCNNKYVSKFEFLHFSGILDSTDYGHPIKAQI